MTEERGGRRLLVVTPVGLDSSLLEERVRSHAGRDAQIQVVVPAAKLSRLQWLANDEDEARADAAAIAERTDAATEAGTHAAAGETDPVQAAEDALRTFAADEIVVVTRPDAESDWLAGGRVVEALGRFELPVTHLVASDGAAVHEAPSQAGDEDADLVQGADEQTPARLLGRVGAIVLGAAAVVTLLVFIVIWLA